MVLGSLDSIPELILFWNEVLESELIKSSLFLPEEQNSQVFLHQYNMAVCCVQNPDFFQSSHSPCDDLSEQLSAINNKLYYLEDWDTYFKTNNN